VFDLDCPSVGGFDEEDRAGLEAVARALGEQCDWTDLLKRIPAAPAPAPAAPPAVSASS